MISANILDQILLILDQILYRYISSNQKGSKDQIPKPRPTIRDISSHSNYFRSFDYGRVRSALKNNLFRSREVLFVNKYRRINYKTQTARIFLANLYLNYYCTADLESA